MKKPAIIKSGPNELTIIASLNRMIVKTARVTVSESMAIPFMPIVTVEEG